MAEQPRETEAKFCVQDLSMIEAHLQESKVHLLIPRIFEVNLRFDNSKGDLRRAGRVLRLRTDALARLTYKENSRQIEGALSRREIEFVVNDFDSAKQFVEALGYEVVFVYEKYRTTFEYRGTQLMLDELPYGNFVEIEGELELLRPIAEKLKLNWEAAIPVSYHALFERACNTLGLTFRDLTFEKFKGIKVSPVDMMIEYADIGQS